MSTKPQKKASSPYEEGSPESRICFLGEAPANVEIVAGRPLVGPSGQLFDQLLHAAGIARSQVYIVNLFETKVKKNKAGDIYSKYNDLLWSKKAGFTNAGLEDSQAAIERIRKSKCNIVCALGGVAAEALYENEISITKLRGSALWSDVIEKKFIPTLHPAFSLRGQYLTRYYTASDFERVKRMSREPELKLRKRDLRIAPFFAEVRAYLNACIRAERVGWDIETLKKARTISCFAFALSPDDAMCIPIISEQGSAYWSVEEEIEIWQLVAAILGDPKKEVITQNGIFDTNYLLRSMHIHTRRRIHDTMVGAHIVWPDFPKGLDFLVSMHTDEPYYKDEGKIWANPWKDMHGFWLYNAKDAALTFEVWEAIEKEVMSDDYRSTYEQTMRLYPALTYMMQRGIKIDRDELKRLQKDIGGKLAAVDARIHEVADYYFNPSSPKQCLEYFYVHKGIKPYVSMKTNQPTTDDKALARIVRRYNLPEARLAQEYRKWKKFLGSYLELGFDEDNRFRCTYNPRGTWTGRLSSSKTVFGTGSNMQNLTSEVKSFLVTDREVKKMTRPT